MGAFESYRGAYEGSLKDFNNSGQTINGYWSDYKFSLHKILLPSSQPYPYDFDVTELEMLPEGVQIKERRKLSFTMVLPYTVNVDNATHVAAKPSEYGAYVSMYKVEDFRILNSSVCEISVVFDAVTTLLVNKPRLTGVVTNTVNGDTPITETYEPTHLFKERCCTFKGTGKVCIYITMKHGFADDWLAQTGSSTDLAMGRGYVNRTTEAIYRTTLSDSGITTIGQLMYQIVASSVTRGGMFVKDIWFEEQPPEGVDVVQGSMELGAPGIGYVSNAITLERVKRYSKVVAQSSHPLPYSQYDTINQPLTSMGVHVLYGDSKTTIPYRNIIDYTNRDSPGEIFISLNEINFEVVYNPTTTSSSNSKLCVYLRNARIPLAEYDIPTSSIGPVSHQYATEHYTYEARNAVAISEEIIQTILALTFNISSLIDSKKKDYSGVADSILSFFFTNAARMASISDMKKLPIEGGGGSMTPINTLYVQYDVTPAKSTHSEYDDFFVGEVKDLAFYERYKRPFSCAVKVTDVDWDNDIFWEGGNSLYYAYMSHVQGNFTISNTKNRYSAAELREMMDVLSDGILIYKRTLVTVEEETKK